MKNNCYVDATDCDGVEVGSVVVCTVKESYSIDNGVVSITVAGETVYVSGVELKKAIENCLNT